MWLWGIETQSSDLYNRLARQSEGPETQKLFYQMADEADRYLA